MHTHVSYADGDQPLQGYLAAPDSAMPLPGVLIAPTWLNVTDGLRRRADRLAGLGHAVFVLDAFGAGVRPGPPAVPADVVRPFMVDRPRYRRRLLAGLDVLRGRPECDRSRVAAVGYCFGGCGVLELARAGAPLRGVVSLHGSLDAPLPARPGTITAKVLALCGDADPVVPFEQVAAFRDEMRRARANWELNVYGDARHGFTGEGTIDTGMPEAGLHPQSEARSWRTMAEFLREVTT